MRVIDLALGQARSHGQGVIPQRRGGGERTGVPVAEPLVRRRCIPEGSVTRDFEVRVSFGQGIGSGQSRNSHRIQQAHLAGVGRHAQAQVAVVSDGAFGDPAGSQGPVVGEAHGLAAERSIPAEGGERMNHLPVTVRQLVLEIALGIVVAAIVEAKEVGIPVGHPGLVVDEVPVGVRAVGTGNDPEEIPGDRMQPALGNLISRKRLSRQRIDDGGLEAAEITLLHLRRRHMREQGRPLDDAQAPEAAEQVDLVSHPCAQAGSELVPLVFRERLPSGIEEVSGVEVVVPVKPVHRAVQSPGLFGGKRVDHLRKRGGRGRGRPFASQSDLVVADLIQGALPGTAATPLGGCFGLLGLGPGRTLIPDADHEPEDEHRFQDSRHTGAHPDSMMRLLLVERRTGRADGWDHNTSAPSTNMSGTEKLTRNRR